MNDLTKRLLAHAEVHDQCTSTHSDEQAQWAADLREAAKAVELVRELVALKSLEEQHGLIRVFSATGYTERHGAAWTAARELAGDQQ